MKRYMMGMVFACYLVGMSACKEGKPPQSINLDEELKISEKFIPYISFEGGLLQLDLTMEQADSIGIDSIHYKPIRATIDTFNVWIAKYHISPEQINNGEIVDVLNEQGDSVHIHLKGIQELLRLKDRSLRQ